MEITDNSALNRELEKFGLYVDDFQNINYEPSKKYCIESMLNAHSEAQAIIDVSRSIVGWLTEKKTYQFVFLNFL